MNNNKIAFSILGVAVLALGVSNSMLYKQVSEMKLSDQQIKEFLLANPQVILDSVNGLQRSQEQAQTEQQNEKVKQNLEALYFDDNTPVFGNPNGEHVVIEFVDYNCHFCRELAPILEEFVKRDQQAKVIVKEFPIFRDIPSSAYSALVGTSLYYYDPALYAQYHSILMHAKSKLSTEQVNNVLATLGVSTEQLQPYLDKANEQILAVRQLGQNIGVAGTPSVIINNQYSLKYSSVEELINQFK